MPKGKYGEYVKPRIPEIRRWIESGVTDRDVAKLLGIAYSTLREYVKKYDDLRSAIREAKVPADQEVVTALYKMAVGHTVWTKKAYKLKNVYYDDEGRRLEDERVEVITVPEYIAPNVEAEKVWLFNRLPYDWSRDATKAMLDKAKFEHEKEMDAKRIW